MRTLALLAEGDGEPDAMARLSSVGLLAAEAEAMIRLSSVGWVVEGGWHVLSVIMVVHFYGMATPNRGGKTARSRSRVSVAGT